MGIQALSSSFMICFIFLIIFYSSYFNVIDYIVLILMICFIIKLGLVPFHFLFYIFIMYNFSNIKFLNIYSTSYIYYIIIISRIIILSGLPPFIGFLLKFIILYNICLDNIYFFLFNSYSFFSDKIFFLFSFNF